MSPQPTPAHLRYYAACTGAWRCPLEMHITDLDGLHRSGMAWRHRLSLRLMAVWPRWLGRFWLFTTVHLENPSTVVHTTAVRWLGLPLMVSTERIALSPDGRSIALTGSQRVVPAMWSTVAVTGQGAVDEGATTASYVFEWLGVQVRQTTVHDQDTVTLTQEGPGFRGVQPLRRHG